MSEQKHRLFLNNWFRKALGVTAFIHYALLDTLAAKEGLRVCLEKRESDFNYEESQIQKVFDVSICNN